MIDETAEMIKADRAEAIKTACAWMLENPLYFDTETTGLGLDAEIVDIAVVDVNGGVILNTLIHPRRLIPEDATAVHGITNEMVQEAPTMDVLWPFLYSLFHCRPVIAFNADYDFRLIRQSVTAYDPADVERGVLELRRRCAMLLYSQFYGEWNDYRQSYRWQSLGSAARRCELEWQGDAHRALADAQMTRKLIAYMASRDE